MKTFLMKAIIWIIYLLTNYPKVFFNYPQGLKPTAYGSVVCEPTYETSPLIFSEIRKKFN